MTIDRRAYALGSPEDTRSRSILKKEEIFRSPEFESLIKLIKESGKEVYSKNNIRVVSLGCSQFQRVEEQIGFALLANLYFKTDMGMAGVSITESENGVLNFLFASNEIKAFCASKIIEDPFDRMIYYVDIQGTDPGETGKGIGKFIGERALKHFVSHTSKLVVILARTQNPKEVGVLKGILPEGTNLVPFWAKPSDEIVESANWLIQSGQISRNARPDFRFDGHESFINWAAYGFNGDGSSWEDMTKFYPDIDWGSSAGTAMRNYAQLHGTNIPEMRLKGHSFIVGALVKNQYN